MKNNMDQGDVDLSVLRTPIPTSVTGFLGVMKAFGDGTEEMRRVLERECDIIYECKVCRNIFRDVANLMTHKRLYCKTAFNSTRDFHFPDQGFINHNISSIVEQESKALETSKREKTSGELPSKDLGGLVQKMRMKQVLSGTMKPHDYYDLVSSKVTLDDVMQRKHLLYLETIPQSSVAVYQTVNQDNGTADPELQLKSEPMKREVDEVNKLETKTDIVVGPDGKALKLSEFKDNVTQDQFELESIEELLLLCNYHQQEELQETVLAHECAICDARFDTEKTLILHIQLKHISSTKVYQCPSCSATFLRAALVIAHLSNDHKKSQKKIRSMRDTIHKRHMRIDEVQVKGPSRELHRLQTEKERIDAENKAYLDNVAFDNSNQSMCTYCNKIFERKAVLTSHMANCRIKFEKMLMGASGTAGAMATPISQSQASSHSSTTTTTSGAKRGPKPKESSSNVGPVGKDGPKEMIHDENSSSSTAVSSDGSTGNENAVGTTAAAENGNENSNEASVAAVPPVKRKRQRKEGPRKSQTKKGKKEENSQQQPQHSKVSELMEKELSWEQHQDERDRDDSYFSFDDKAPEDARDETYKRRFPCEVCNKSFSTMSNLKRHNVMFHYFQHRYSCRVCNLQCMKKDVALAHLREVHKVDKEEHEMKAMLKQEKNEVSSSEVLDLDLDETSSNRDRSTERDISRTCSPVSHLNSMTPANITTTTTTTSPAESLANSSNSSGVASGPSPTVSNDTPVAPRKRGRPKGSFRKVAKPTTPVDRELRTDSASPKKDKTISDLSELDEFLEIKKKTSSLGSQPQPPIVPAPPQLMDNNSSSSSAASSRPIRNRTKPKDKDFVYDLSSLKCDFIYEDDAMDTAMSESLLSAQAAENANSSLTSLISELASSSSLSVTPLLPEPVKIFKKRTSSAEPRQASNGLMESIGDCVANGAGSSKRSVGRPKVNKTVSGEEKSGKTKSSKNVMIPTRIIEHRHSVDTRPQKTAVDGDFKKDQEMRRNSIEIMIKGGGVANVNNRHVGGSGPLGMIENLMDDMMARAVTNTTMVGHPMMTSEPYKDFALVNQNGHNNNNFVSETSMGMANSDHHVLLNGRSLGEILSMSTNGVVGGMKE